MTKEMQVMNEVLEALNGNKLSNEQMDKLLLIMSQQLSERAPTKEIKQDLDNQVKDLLKQVKYNEIKNQKKAFNKLKENFDNNKKITKDTLKNIEIIKDDIDYTKEEKEFISWLEDIMTIKKGKPYRITNVKEPIIKKDTKFRLNKHFTDEVFQMNNPSLNGALLKSIAQKGILTAYDIQDIEHKLHTESSITSLLKQRVKAEIYPIIQELVNIINKRDSNNQKRTKALY